MFYDVMCLDAFGNSVIDLYQWDRDIYLYVPDWEYGVTTVHFCNEKSEAVIPMPSTFENDMLKVKIPNVLLEQPYTICGYMYIGDADGGNRTIYTITVPVKKRLRPEDYEYDEDSDSALVLTDAINKLDARISNMLAVLSENPDLVVAVEITDARIGNDGTVYSCVGDHIRAISQDLEEAKTELKKYAESVSNVADLKYEDNHLYLVDNDNQTIGDGVTITGGGGGSGGSSDDSIWKVKNTMSGVTFTVPVNADGNADMTLQFSYQSVEDDDPVPGSVEIYVNSVKKGLPISIVQPTTSPVNVSVDVGKYLTSGTMSVRLHVTDANGHSRNLNYTITVISLYVTSTFNDATVYSDDIVVYYTPYGAIEKNIVFKLDGTEIASVKNSSSGKESQYTIPKTSLTHGDHVLTIKMDADIGNGQTIESNELSYGILFDDGSSGNVIIGSGFNQTTAKEGEVINIPYFVYTPGAQTSDVTLTIKDASDNTYWTSNLEGVEQKQQTWTIRKFPTGNGVKFIISSGTGSNKATKTFSLDITASDVQLEVTDYDGTAKRLVSRLNALGKTNRDAGRTQWVEELSGNNVTTLSEFNYETNGWINDALEVSGNAVATVGLYLFDEDFKGKTQYGGTNGKTIEFEFETKDVKNADTVIFQCKYGSAGIVATPQTFTFSARGTTISIIYQEGERSRIGVVVEPMEQNGELKENRSRLIHIYMNGIDSGAVQYPTNESFIQGTPQPITIGSTECTTRIYSILEYDVALNRYEMLNNYMADRDSMDEKIEIRDRNAIYDDYNEIVFDLLNGYIPCMIVTGASSYNTGALPTYKGEKKWVNIDYIDASNDANNFHWENVMFNVQGTSSQYYPRKNYKMQSVKGKKDIQKVERTTVDEEGNQKPKYCLDSRYILPCTDFCLKADFAESSGTHNTGLAKLIPSLYSAQTPPQIDNPDEPIRTTIYGFPICLFYRETENDTPVFLGKYNFNSDKGSENTFGFDKDVYTNCECWEVKNNYSFRNVWLTDNYDDNSVFGKVSDDFERRFPDEDDEDYPVDYTQLHRLASWLASTAVETDFSEDYAQYLSKPDDTKAVDATYGGVHYTHDTKEYRLAKFKAEFENYFNMDYCLVYYICAEFFAMADSRAKNMMLATWDGEHWFPIFYDMDTVLGINNQGEIAYKYNVEFQDTLVMDGSSEGATQDVFNGRLSVLWNNFGTCFQDRIQQKYNDMRSGNNIFNFSVFTNIFETQQSNMWCESVYNEDGNVKYIIPAVEGAEYTNPDDTEGEKIPAAQFLVDLQGSRQPHRIWWLKNRLSYMDSKYLNAAISSDTISMRVNFPQRWIGVQPSSTFDLIPYIDLYCYVRLGAGAAYVGQRGWQNELVSITPPRIGNDNNLETVICGASMMSDIGDLSSKYLGSLDASKGVRLSRLIIGSHVNGYVNTNLTFLTVGTNNLLREINVENCPALRQSLDVSKCENIQKIYAKGSGITGVALADSGYLTDMELPATLTQLHIFNQQDITNFQIEGADNLEELFIQNCKGIPEAGLVTYCPSIMWIALLDVDWTSTGNGALENSGALRKLLTIEKGLAKTSLGISATNSPVVTGKIHCNTNPADKATLLSQLNSKFPELTVTFGSATEYKIDFKVTEADGRERIVATEYVAAGSYCPDPRTRDICPIEVTKDEYNGYSYSFANWDYDIEANTISANRTINAVFNESVALSYITWYDPYGAEGETNATSRAAINAKASPQLWPKSQVLVEDETSHEVTEFVFVGWQSSDTTLELDDLTVTGTHIQFSATYEPVEVPADFATTTTTTTEIELTWPQIRALCKDSKTTIEQREGANGNMVDYLCYNGNAKFSTGATKKVVLTSGSGKDWVVVWEVAGFNKDDIYDETTDTAAGRAEGGVVITWVMKYAWTTSVAQNSQTRMCFNYTLGTAKYEAYKNGMTYTTVDYTHNSGAGNVKLTFNDFSYISSIKVTKTNGNTITWRFDSTATNTSDEANLIYGAITTAANDADGFLAHRSAAGRGAEFDFHGLICYRATGDLGDMLPNYNNDANTASSTMQVEFQAGSYFKIPVETGDKITITHCATYNNGGYYYGGYRTWVNGTFIPMFPRAFRNSLQIPNTLVNLGLYSKTLVTFHDTLYPLSPVEVGYSTTLTYQLRQGKMALPVFTDNDSRKKWKADKNGDQTGSAQPWWLRTSRTDRSDFGFPCVNEQGSFYFETGSFRNRSYSVVLGCIT